MSEHRRSPQSSSEHRRCRCCSRRAGRAGTKETGRRAGASSEAEHHPLSRRSIPLGLCRCEPLQRLNAYAEHRCTRVTW